jgi:hypothetical protein
MPPQHGKKLRTFTLSGKIDVYCTQSPIFCELKQYCEDPTGVNALE